jgi:hypothetical protein
MANMRLHDIYSLINTTKQNHLSSKPHRLFLGGFFNNNGIAYG